MKVLRESGSLSEFSRDAGIIRITPEAVYLAQSEAEVAEVIALGKELNKTVTPRGAGTSIPSQAIGGGLILLQERNGFSFSRDGVVVCEPGLVKQDLNRALDPRGSWVPVDPSSYRSCTVGGMVANNSSGPRTLKYGSTLNHVKELRAVLPESGPVSIRPMPVDDALGGSRETRRVAELIIENQKTILEERPKVTKNSCGYRLDRVLHDGIFDLPRLFVGSEGTLGVITEITFREAPKPASKVLVTFESSLSELGRSVSALRSFGPSAIELVDKSVFRSTGREGRLSKYSKTEDPYLVFCEFDGGADGETDSTLAGIAESEVAGLEPKVLVSPEEMSEAWDVRNETLTIAGEIKDGFRVLLPGVEDLVVPPPELGGLIKVLTDQFEGRGLRYISYGHAGDANLHMRPLLDPNSPSERRVLSEIMEECFEAVWKMGGSITGEHGDGMLRAEYVERQYPKTHSLMKQVREIYDPKRILNPGVKII